MAKLTDYKPLKRNPNKGTQRGTGILEQSVRELGAGRSILVDKNGVILAGNHAQEAFVNAGIDDVIEVETSGNQVVVVKRTDLDADSSAGKKMAIMDNRTSEQGLAWDAIVVEDLLNEIKQDEGELDAYLESLAKDTGAVIGDPPAEDQGAQIDKAEELRLKWGVELGQLWQLGEHRLICGDCTDKAVVDMVMGWEKSVVCVTDPPYGIEYEYNKDYKDIEGKEYTEFCDKWFSLSISVSPLAIITTGWKYKPYWYSKNPTGEMVWFDKTKQSGHSTAHLRKSEPIFVFGKINNKYDWDTFENEGSRNDGVRELHTCPKPISLFEKLIERQSNHNEIVYEPFLGSGTTLIACERLNRKCRAVEISPAYCAVAIQRWVDMTGQEPVKLTD